MADVASNVAENPVTLGKTTRRVRCCTLGRLPKGLGRVRLKVFRFRDQLEKAVLERSGALSKYAEARCQSSQPFTSKPLICVRGGFRGDGTR